MINRRRFCAITAGAAVASPAQTSLAATNSTSFKRGACFTTKSGSDWLRRVEALNAAWMYSWGPRRPKILPDSIDFAPMIWGDSPEERLTEKIAELRQAIQNGRIRNLMAFNEPDQVSQSNMTVDRVIELWPRLMELDVPLVSPGCVHPDREWMRRFMKKADQQNLRVDVVAVHSYGGPNAGHLMDRLKKVYREYGRPLWITEFAVGDWKAKRPEENRHSPAVVASFMRDILPALDAAPFVHRYSWFPSSQKSGPLGTSALFDQQGKLTDLGRIYAAGG